MSPCIRHNSTDIFSGRKPDNCVIIIFGGSGHLALRKLLPALSSLYSKGKMPEKFFVAGCGRKDLPEDFYRGLKEIDDDFSENVIYQKVLYTGEGILKLRDRLMKECTKRNIPPNFVYYMATPSSAYCVISNYLNEAGMIYPSEKNNWSRAVFEKPYGRDRKSASVLNSDLLNNFNECQIYRIDHYLGKAAVQNILIFRFLNSIFAPVWNREYISDIQIFSSEDEGVGGRASYFDAAGIIRDMVQNHLMQVLCLLTMDKPEDFGSDSIRDRKKELLGGLSAQSGGQKFCTGVYKGYKDEPGIPEGSRTPTFVCVRMELTKGNLAGVPVFLSAGKKLSRRGTDIAVNFKRPVYPGKINVSDVPSNRIIFKIQPSAGIILDIAGKNIAGEGFSVSANKMNFCYSSSAVPEAYETLLMDVLRGGSALFVRSDETEAAWKVIDPVIAESEKLENIQEYNPGEYIPECAAALMKEEGIEPVDFRRYANDCT
ncbi:MAG: glucose-6-phosphate dehydrogenase [Fibrobacterota bacterium]